MAAGVRGAVGGDRADDICMPGFIGREQEVATLVRALAGPSVVLVEGEAGIGKSRLIQEFLATVRGDHRILVGVCPPYRESLTLGPIVDAVRQARECVAGLQLSPLAGALRPLFPEWAADLPPAPEPLSDPRAAHHRLFRALAELIGTLEATVLVVEDVHWADGATLDFLLFLTCRLPQPVNLVVTYRPEDVPPTSPLLRLSSRLPATTTQLRLTLEPLDVAATARMVSSMLGGQPVSPALAKFLHQRTDGVPLAVEESVRLLRDRADLVRDARGWRRRGSGELQVPPTVRDAVLERVQRLGEPARRVLQAAAVLGEAVDGTIVQQVAGLADDAAYTGLAEAIACGLLREDAKGQVTFRHMLPGRAVYEAVPAVERRRLHLHAGDVLERLAPPPVLQLTRHFRAANDSRRWATYAEQAAELAVASGDHGSATVLLHDLLRGADLPLDDQVRVARKLALAAMFRRDSIDDLHSRIVRILRNLVDSGRLAPHQDGELRSALGMLLAQQGELEAARVELELAVPNLDHRPAEAARAMAYLGIPFIGHRPGSVHLRWLRRVAQVDTTALPPAERLGLTVDRAGGLLLLGDEAGWAVAAQIPTTAETAEERRQVVRGHLNVGTAAVRWGLYPQARSRLLTALALADADGHLRVRAKILVVLAQLDWYTGAWDGLGARVSELVGPDAVGPVAYLGATRLGLWYAATGEWRKAEDQCRRALDTAQRAGAVDDVLEPAAALGRLRLLEGRVGEALKVTEDPMRTILIKGIWLWATEIAPVRVEALVGAGELAEAAELVGRYRRWMRGRTAPAPAAALIACQARLISGRGEHERAARLFGAAAAAWERLPRPYDAWLAREAQARCLLAAGRTESAVSLLDRTLRGLSNLGARADADRVGELLRDHGVPARRTWRRGRRGYGNQLSPRELEVVRLLVTGRTNREIADALSRSPKTVAGQLSSAMRKLGVSSRTALAVAAVDAGLVPDGAAEA
ncbi:MAG TPA: AAA family ATPase [Natronosporangium sp.]|nr:AAA family ATPase [Natronosporangium sp.]